jgi:hypothetical protein
MTKSHRRDACVLSIDGMGRSQFHAIPERPCNIHIKAIEGKSAGAPTQLKQSKLEEEAILTHRESMVPHRNRPDGGP